MCMCVHFPHFCIIPISQASSSSREINIYTFIPSGRLLHLKIMYVMEESKESFRERESSWNKTGPFHIIRLLTAYRIESIMYASKLLHDDDHDVLLFSRSLQTGETLSLVGCY